MAGAAAPESAVSEPTPVGNVRLGPVLKLVDRKASISAMMGPDGHIDLIVASQETQARAAQVRFSHIVIESDVVGEEETITTVSSDHVENFDAALDPSGNLHPVIDSNHYTRTLSGWAAPEEGPACRRLIVAADTLVCVLVVSGADVGSPRRWQWYLVPGGLVFPWHEQTQKLVLTRRTATGWSDWTVIDPETKFDVGNAALGADDTGAVHVIYIPMSSIFGTPAEHLPRYARIERASQPLGSPNAPSDARASGTQHVAASVTGQDMLMPGLEVSLAVDPTSGQVFGTCYGRCAKGASPAGFTIDNGIVSKPFGIPSDRGFPFANAYTAAAGKGRYHVVVGVTTGHFKQRSHLTYLTFADGKWSDPIALGDAAGRQGRTFDLQLVSDRSGHAFLTWLDNEDSKPRGRSINLAD